MKKAPTVIPTSTRNLKNQKLINKKEGLVQVCSEHELSLNVNIVLYSIHVWPPESSVSSLFRVVVLKLQYKPILDGGPGVLAAAHSDHDEGEEEEEAGHGEAHSVH